jgi:hypothetical protein
LKRVRAVGAAAIGVLAFGAMPAQGATGDWAATGAVTGTLEIENLPGYFKVCAWNLPFELALDSPAAAFKTPTGTSVTPLAIRGSGVTTCASESVAGSYSFPVEFRIGDTHCRGGATFQKIAVGVQMVAWAAGDCPQRGSWVFELAYDGGKVAGPFVVAT